MTGPRARREMLTVYFLLYIVNQSYTQLLRLMFRLKRVIVFPLTAVITFPIATIVADTGVRRFKVIQASVDHLTASSLLKYCSYFFKTVLKPQQQSFLPYWFKDCVAWEAVVMLLVACLSSDTS